MLIYSISTNQVELPPELIYKIISWCTPMGLLAFCLANKACKYEAEKYLYRNLRLSPPTEKCLVVLSQHPNKASLVWSFSLFRSSSTSFSEGENDLLCQALPLMKNLRHLSLWVKEDYSDLLSGAVLQCDFQLLTMCIPRSLRDCAQISSQLFLQSLGFYDGPDEINMDELTRYEALVKSNIDQKQFLIFHLTQTHLDTLIVFPVFYRMSSVIRFWDNVTLPGNVAASISPEDPLLGL
ncbi:hypothetical protein BDZ94DRAFT_1338213 [Collybia nuda]|uniref:F-box domain-containing protein n=1 Tax=Collybia nuda TaxID=64659 RepID=A0A9P5XUA6_9AGAR|nr:hypothetical protein BDZ94DRAFT_1338213 [Collybia nuda]